MGKYNVANISIWKLNVLKAVFGCWAKGGVDCDGLSVVHWALPLIFKAELHFPESPFLYSCWSEYAGKRNLYVIWKMEVIQLQPNVWIDKRFTMVFQHTLKNYLFITDFWDDWQKLLRDSWEFQ